MPTVFLPGIGRDDADGFGFECPLNVVGERGDRRDFHAGGQVRFVHCDDRAGVDFDDVGVDVEFLRMACSRTAAFSRTNFSWLSANPCSASVQDNPSCGRWYRPVPWAAAGARSGGALACSEASR